MGECRPLRRVGTGEVARHAAYRRMGGCVPASTGGRSYGGLRFRFFLATAVRRGSGALQMTKAAGKNDEPVGKHFLVEAPESGVDVRGIICLDFDGVLNKHGHGHGRRLPQVVAGGRSWGIDLDPDILPRLDAVVQQPGIWLAWTTTWGTQMALLRPLFNGCLEGGFVAVERPPDIYVDIGWKETAVLRLAQQFPHAKLARIDDTAVPNAFSSGTATRELSKALLIAPDPLDGLHLQDVTEIDEFFQTEGDNDGHTS